MQVWIPFKGGNSIPGSIAGGAADFLVDEIITESSHGRNQPSLGMHRRSGIRHSEASENQLLGFAASGDQRAFTELWLRYSGSVMKTIFRIVRNREDAEDVLQETVLSAFKNLGGFRGNCSFHTWITRIGINESLMLLRKRRRRRSEFSMDSDHLTRTDARGLSIQTARSIQNNFVRSAK